MVFLLLCALTLGLNVLAILYLRARRRSTRRAFRVPPSLSLEKETDRCLRPDEEWEHKYVPVSTITLTTSKGKTWVQYKEEVPMLGYNTELPAKTLRRYRIVFN